MDMEPKESPVNQNTPEHNPDGPAQARANGEQGISVAPPEYGLGFLDQPQPGGLPAMLKKGIESLSGMSLDDVKVHYNSSKPAQLQALAYTQGAEIHVAPGQERHLPHEAWHVVQQKQGRVKPTLKVNGTPVNDEPALEQEADQMGARLRGPFTPVKAPVQTKVSNPAAFQRKIVQRQRKMGFEMEDADWRSWKKTWGVRAPYWKSPQDNKNCRPMKKREVLHQGTGFKLEADEFVEDSKLLSDIEFVTDPFPLTDGGYQQLDTALTEIGNIYNTIIPLRDRDHKEGEFIKSDESGFSVNNAMLSKGASRAKLKIQATQGFSLQDIPKAFDALSKPAEQANSDEEAQAYAVLQHTVVGDKDASQEMILEPLRSASDRAWDVTLEYLVDHIDESVVPRFEISPGEFKDLYGFLTAVIGFIRMMRNPQIIQGGAKTFTPMMHRNDFATLFGLLSGRLRALLQGNRQVFIDAIIAGVVVDIEEDDPLEDYDPVEYRNEFIFQKFLLENGDRRRFLDPARGLELPNQAGKSLGYYILPPSFTIERWVTAWMDARDPKDLLTTAHFEFAAHNDIDPNPALDENLQTVKNALEPRVAAMIDWGRSKYEQGRALLAFKYSALSPQQKEILIDYARGLGGLGQNTDPQNRRLVLYENRDIAPEYKDEQNRPLNPSGGKLDMASARHTALHYFLAMQELFGE